MTTLTLKFEVEEHWVNTYRKAKPSEKSRIKALIQDLFKHALFQDKARHDMYSALDKLHDEAESNGINDDIIEELLADES